MAKSIVFQEISEQPPTTLLLPPFHLLTTTQTKPTKKHLRAQLNWQNTTNSDIQSGLHKLWYPVVRDMSTWSKFGAHGEHGDVFLFSNLGAL